MLILRATTCSTPRIVTCNGLLWRIAWIKPWPYNVLVLIPFWNIELKSSKSPNSWQAGKVMKMVEMHVYRLYIDVWCMSIWHSTGYGRNILATVFGWKMKVGQWNKYLQKLCWCILKIAFMQINNVYLLHFGEFFPNDPGYTGVF